MGKIGGFHSFGLEALSYMGAAFVYI
jgi:hypothetical protein